MAYRQIQSSSPQLRLTKKKGRLDWLQISVFGGQRNCFGKKKKPAQEVTSKDFSNTLYKWVWVRRGAPKFFSEMRPGWHNEASDDTTKNNINAGESNTKVLWEYFGQFQNHPIKTHKKPNSVKKHLPVNLNAIFPSSQASTWKLIALLCLSCICKSYLETVMREYWWVGSVAESHKMEVATEYREASIT